MRGIACPVAKPVLPRDQREHFARVRELLHSFIAADRHRFSDGKYKPIRRIVFDLRCDVGESTVYHWLQQDHPQVLQAMRDQRMHRQLLKSMQRLGITDDADDTTTDSSTTN